MTSEAASDAGRRQHYADLYDPTPHDGPTGVLLGNCQAESLRQALAGSDVRLLRVPPVHELEASDLPHLERLLAGVDVVVAQPIRDDYRGMPLGTRQLLDAARVGARSAIVPVIRFTGLHPWQAIVRPQETVARIPDSLTFDAAAALVHAGVCSLTCLADTARLAPGQRVLIHGGSGSIGALSIQLAKSLGAFVATTCREVNSAYARAMGADLVIPYDTGCFTRTSEKFDVVLDLVGGEAHRKSYQVLRRGGHLVCLNAAPISDLSAQHDVRMTMVRISEPPEMLDRVMSLAEGGVFRPGVAKTMPLEQAADAHRLMEAGLAARGRIVLTVPPLPPHA